MENTYACTAGRKGTLPESDVQEAIFQEKEKKAKSNESQKRRSCRGYDLNKEKNR